MIDDAKRASESVQARMNYLSYPMGPLVRLIVFRPPAAFCPPGAAQVTVQSEPTPRDLTNADAEDLGPHPGGTRGRSPRAGASSRAPLSGGYGGGAPV